MDTRLELTTDDDLNEVRRILRSAAEDLRFTKHEQTRLITAASEICRNVLNYTPGGRVHIQHRSDPLPGLEVQFQDDGPGIDDLDRALEDGYTGETSNGLGVGLPGAKRLSDQFEIESEPDQGTTVTLVVHARKDST